MSIHAVVMSPRLPWPLDDGGRIGLWQTVWAAAHGFETTLLCLVPPGTENDPLPGEIEALGIEVIRIPHRPPPLPVAAWQGIAGRWPYTLARYQSRELSAAVHEIAIRRRPEFFLVNHLHLAPYVEVMAGVPMVLREHNIEHRWMARYAGGLPPGPKRWYAQIQAGRLRSAEIELCERSALVLSIQDKESAALKKLCPGTRVEQLPVAIDPAWYPPPDPAEPPIVLICGAFGWAPNVDGALAFLRQGWPALAQRFPEVRLRIAGKDPPAVLREEADRAGAEVTGYVESMPVEFAQAAVLLVPLWVGAGARVKIIEAAIAGLPVVSTSLGAEGLGLRTGVDFLLGDTPAELADRVSSLLESPEERRRLAQNALEVARCQWSMEAVAKLQNRLCAEIAGVNR
jgi:glycosyltransferase involved in cell wall biosynthesis